MGGSHLACSTRRSPSAQGPPLPQRRVKPCCAREQASSPACRCCPSCHCLLRMALALAGRALTPICWRAHGDRRRRRSGGARASPSHGRIPYQRLCCAPSRQRAGHHRFGRSVQVRAGCQRSREPIPFPWRSAHGRCGRSERDPDEVVGPRPAIVSSCEMNDRATGRTLPSSPSAPNDTPGRSVRGRADLRAGCRPTTLGGAAPTGSAEPSDRSRSGERRCRPRTGAYASPSAPAERRSVCSFGAVVSGAYQYVCA